MGIIKEIEVQYGKTINKGNYESERIDLSARLALNIGEASEDVYRSMFAYLKKLANDLTDSE